MNRIINVSASIFGKRNDYACVHDWPKDCFIQGGGGGMVFTGGTLEQAFNDPQKAIEVITGKAEHYITAFFEAFPRNPNCFLRGEGKTVADAEAACWKWYQQVITCAHDWCRRGRDDYALCAKCKVGMSHIFDSLDHCHVCDDVGKYGSDKDGNPYCQIHFKALSDDRLEKFALMHRDFCRRLKAQDPELHARIERQMENS